MVNTTQCSPKPVILHTVIVLDALCTFINKVLNFLSAPEFKLSITSVIHKGKGKSKTHHKSFRLVRSCPLIGRIIDEHMRPMAVQLSRPRQSIRVHGECFIFVGRPSEPWSPKTLYRQQANILWLLAWLWLCLVEVVCRDIQKRELYTAGETGQLTTYNTWTYNNTQTRLITMRSKPDYVEFVLL